MINILHFIPGLAGQKSRFSLLLISDYNPRKDKGHIGSTGSRIRKKYDALGKRLQPKTVQINCLICTEVFPNNRKYRKHMQTHNTGVGPYKCRFCCKEFAEFGQIQIHKNEHLDMDESNTKIYDASNMKYYCVICPKVLCTLKRYEGHVEAHRNAESPFVCVFCKKEFTSFDEICAHKKHHKSLDKPCQLRKFVCLLCKKSLGYRRVYNKHVESHRHDSKPFVCKFCHKEFQEFEEICAHKKDHRYLDRTMDDRQFKCIICPDILQSVRQYNEHVECHREDPPPFVCLFCNKEFTNFDKILAHKEEHKSLDQVHIIYCILCRDFMVDDQQYEKHLHKCLETKNPPYTCARCKATFSSSVEVFAHRLDHTRKKNLLKPKKKKAPRDPETNNSVSGKYKYHCIMCETVCSSLLSYQKHSQTHNGQQLPFSCRLCKMEFVNFDEICAHKSSNHNDIDKPVVCEMCGLRCHTKSQLVIHIRSHTGERSFVCDICSKAFRQRSHLKSHMNSHAKEKTFLCEICSKTFGHSQSLNWHMRNMHNTERATFVCSYENCGASYKSKRTLQHHVDKNHLKKLPFTCTLCYAKSYASKQYLARHIRRIHKAEINSEFLESDMRQSYVESFSAFTFDQDI